MLYIQTYIKVVNGPSFSKPFVSIGHGAPVLLVGFAENKAGFSRFAWDEFRRLRVVATDVSSM